MTLRSAHSDHGRLRLATRSLLCACHPIQASSDQLPRHSAQLPRLPYRIPSTRPVLTATLQVPEKLKSQSETIQLLTAKLKELNTAHDALQERSAHLEAALKEHGALQAELDQLRKANKVAEAQKVALLDRQEALQVSCKVSCKAAESERDAALVELEHLRAELPQAHPVQQPLDRQPQDVQAEDDDVVVVAEDFAMNVPATDILPVSVPARRNTAPC